MCYLTNQWIAYNLPINLIDAQALSGAIYITSFYMYPLASHVKSLQSIQLTTLELAKQVFPYK